MDEDAHMANHVGMLLQLIAVNKKLITEKPKNKNITEIKSGRGRMKMGGGDWAMRWGHSATNEGPLIFVGVWFGHRWRHLLGVSNVNSIHGEVGAKSQCFFEFARVVGFGVSIEKTWRRVMDAKVIENLLSFLRVHYCFFLQSFVCRLENCQVLFFLLRKAWRLLMKLCFLIFGDYIRQFYREEWRNSGLDGDCLMWWA